MPIIEEADLSEYAVVWRCVGLDGYSKAVLAFPPVEIACRWKSGSKATRPQVGTEDLLMAVSEAVPKQSVVWIGRLADLPNVVSDPDFPDVDLFTVIDDPESPDVRGVETRRNLILQRYRCKIPTQ